ncbi:MAG: VWA domain-containing protein [Acidobacteriia bacterium]|nr:VWA domain-containing protein [Terriglobia bacterium]
MRLLFERRITSFAAAAAVLLLFSSGSQPAETEKPPVPQNVFKISANLVVVDVQVVDKKTLKAVGGLTGSDFAVYEGGVRQEITHFSRDTMPLSIVFLFDITATVRPVLRQLAEGAGQALRHLRPEDEVAVMAFTKTARVVEDFTFNTQKIANAIGRASRLLSLNSERALMNEAVYQAAVQSRKSHNAPGRRVIIVLNDALVANFPRGHVHSERQAFGELFESDSMVCGLVAQSSLSKLMAVLYVNNPMFLPAIKALHPGSLRNYAQRTGGEVILATESGISEKLADLLDHLRARYSLGYSPSNVARDGKFRSIKVKLSPEQQARWQMNLVIRAKEGYYAR